MEPVEGFRARQGDPLIRKATRRQVWREIYLPFALGTAVILILLGVSWPSVTSDPAGLADASLGFLLIPLLVGGLLVLAALLAVIFALTWGMSQLPYPAHEVRRRIDEVSARAQQASGMVLAPISAIEGARAAAAAVWKWIRHGTAADL